MRHQAIAPLIAAMLLAGSANAQTTNRTADDIDRALAAMVPGAGFQAGPSDGGADVGPGRPVPCMFCGVPEKAKGPATIAPRMAAYRSGATSVPALGRSAPRPHSASTRVDMALTFPNGSDHLDRLSMPELDKYVDALSRTGQAGRHFMIEGHTSSVGARDRNLDLSQRRAKTVVDYLVAHGIDAARLEPRGVGQADPLPGKAATDPANRRVEIKPL